MTEPTDPLSATDVIAPETDPPTPAVEQVHNPETPQHTDEVVVIDWETETERDPDPDNTPDED